ncbi:MAG: VOC family protein [Nitrospinota bacterium]
MTSSVRLKGLHHITLVTRDMEVMMRFLTDVVGIPLIKSDVNLDVPGQKHCFWGDEGGRPGTLVTFFEIPDLDDNRLGAGGMHHVAFTVQGEDDLRAQIKRLEEKGISHSGVIDRNYWKALYFQGPEGLLIEFATEGPGFK